MRGARSDTSRPRAPRRRSDRLDAFQRRHPVLGFPIAVVYKFLDDQGVYLAALMTYYGFLSLFPLLLLFTSIVGFVVQGDPQLRTDLLNSAISQFPVVRTQFENRSGLTGSVTAVVAGLLIATYGALGIAQATQNAMNTAWAVPRHRRPNPIRGRLRSLLLLATGGLVVLATTILGAVAAQTDALGITAGRAGKAVIALAGIAINAMIFVVGMRITTAIRLSTRQVIVGAVLNAGYWYLLQVFGARYVKLFDGAQSTYGTFGIVLGLFGWIFLSAIVLVLCVEINVVRTKQLYPRALMTLFTDNVDLTEADRRIYAEMVGAQRLKGFSVVDVSFRHDGQYRSAQREALERMAELAAAGADPSGPLVRPGAPGVDSDVEIVERDGTVTGVVPRSVMRANVLRHRVVMVAILHPERDEILVHQRADWKDIWPSRWDLAFGGVVGVGEPWEEAAVRELAEESGLLLEPGELNSLGPPVTYDDADVAELSRAWWVRAEGPFTFADGEVQRTRWLALDEFDTWLAAHAVCPDTVAVIIPHLREFSGRVARVRGLATASAAGEQDRRGHQVKQGPERDEGVEDLVVPEVGGPRVGPVHGVDGAAGRVDETAGGEEGERHGGHLGPERGRLDQHDPADEHVRRGDHGVGSVDPQHPHRESQEGAGPHRDEQDRAR